MLVVIIKKAEERIQREDAQREDKEKG